MNFLTKTIATLTVAASTFVPINTSIANAGERGFYRHNGGGFCSPRDPRCGGYRPQRHQQNGNHNGISRDDALGIAILGVVGGVIIGSALNQNRQQHVVRQPQYQPQYKPRHYQNTRQFPPAPRRNEPRVITLNGSLEPWTASWYNYCDDRYRSFNPKTGTYRGYDGKDHFCVAN